MVESYRGNGRYQELHGHSDRSPRKISIGFDRRSSGIRRLDTVHKCRKLSNGKNSIPYAFFFFEHGVKVLINGQCASAIRWAGFREYVYATSIDTLIEQGWGQIRINSIDVFQASFDLPHQSRLMGNLLTNETDPYFLWQYNSSYPCPAGCSRTEDGTSCHNHTT